MKLLFKYFVLIIFLISVKPDFITAQLNWIIPLQQDIHFTRFNSDLKVFQNIKSLKWGVINRKGKIIIPAKYKEIFIINSNLFRVKSDYVYLIDRNQNIVFGKYEKYTIINFEPILSSDKYGLVFTYRKQGLYGLKSLSDKLSIDAKYQSLIPLTDEFIKFYQDEKFGLLNIQGDTICLPIYNYIGKADETLMILSTEKKTILLDSSSKIVLPEIYNGYYYVDSNHIIAQKNVKANKGKYIFGIIDINNNIKLSFQYKHIIHQKFNGDSFFFVEKDGKQGLLNKNLEIVIPIIYSSLQINIHSFVFEKDDKYGVITASNDILIDAEYDYLTKLKDIFIGKKGDTYFLINFLGEIIKELEVDDINSIGYDPVSSIKKDGKWGYIRHDGKFIGEVKYDLAHSFQSGYGKVRFNGKYGMVDIEGKEVIPCKYDDFYIGDDGFITVVDRFHVGLVKLP